MAKVDKRIHGDGVVKMLIARGPKHSLSCRLRSRSLKVPRLAKSDRATLWKIFLLSLSSSVSANLALIF
jgi:hypothetical protein